MIPITPRPFFETLVVLALAWTITGSGVCAQTANPVEESRIHQRSAVAAYQEANYSQFLEHSLAAARLRPTHPGLMYNLAIAYSLNGQPEEALKWLERYAMTGSVVDLENEDLVTLQGVSGIGKVSALIRKNQKPVGTSRTAFEVLQSDILAEGIAFDPENGDFYVSGVHKRKIIRIGPTGDQDDFFTGDSTDVAGILSMRVDANNRVLWAGSAGLAQVAGLDSTQMGKSAVLKFDLDTGELLDSLAPADSEPHVFGDLTTNDSGDVFVSDGRGAALYMISAQRNVIEPFLKGDPFVSPQGLAFDTEEQFLFVADYSRGIIRIDMTSHDATILPQPQGSTLLGIDGLVFKDGALIGVQNGINPYRILKMTLSDELTSITSIEIVESNNPIFDEPTQGVIVGDEYFYIANSQWGSFGSDGRVIDGALLKNPVILVTKL